MPIHAVVFDLDDTLYCEMDFVISGFKAVAKYLGSSLSIDPDAVLEDLVSIIERSGRGRVFNTFLERHVKDDPDVVSTCLHLYRSHTPKISLTRDVQELLIDLSESFAMFVVTDGNVQVQMNKYCALGLNCLIDGIVPTWALGESAGKPNLDAFEVLRKLLVIEWKSFVYVGDNPYKDFVNLNLQGVPTIRLLSGPFADVKVSPAWDARYRVHSLSELPQVLKELD